MIKSEALKIQQEIEELCRKHGLWMQVEHDIRGGDLHMIRIKEISIKVGSEQPAKK